MPPEIKQNEAKETCDGSKWGCLGMPNKIRPFPVGCNVNACEMHMADPGNGLDAFTISKNQSHAIVASEITST